MQEKNCLNIDTIQSVGSADASGNEPQKITEITEMLSSLNVASIEGKDEGLKSRKKR